jgi:hypothetical protein
MRAINFLLVTTLYSLSFSLASASSDSLPPHLVQAEAIAHEIDQSHNEYAHKGCFIKWKGEDGASEYENRTDCSDFLDLLLEHTYHFTRDHMKTWTGRERPLATTWYDTIHAGNGFEVIGDIQAIKPGDIIAVHYPPGEGDTGHIMIAAGVARERRASAPEEPDTRQWELDVVDSSKSGHGKNDTRWLADGTFARGVGEGTLRLYSNSDGMIAGYAWSVLSPSKFVPVSEHPLVVGRMRQGN